MANSKRLFNKFRHKFFFTDKCFNKRIQYLIYGHNILMRLCYQYNFVVYIILVYLTSVPTYWWAAIHYTLMQIMTSVPTGKDQSQNPILWLYTIFYS